MSCCGRGIPPQGWPLASGRQAPASSVPAGPRRYSHVYFEYAGATALTAVGGATGKSYRFERPGARVAVDPTDQASIARVPNLRLVLGP